MFSWLVECGLDSTDNGVYTERKKTAKPLYGELKQHSLSTGKWRWFMKKQEYDSGGNSSVTFLIWLMNWIFPFIRRVMMMQNCNVHSDQKNKRKKIRTKMLNIFLLDDVSEHKWNSFFTDLLSGSVIYKSFSRWAPYTCTIPQIKLSYFSIPIIASTILRWFEHKIKACYRYVTLRWWRGVYIPFSPSHLDIFYQLSSVIIVSSFFFFLRVADSFLHWWGWRWNW